MWLSAGWALPSEVSLLLLKSTMKARQLRKYFAGLNLPSGSASPISPNNRTSLDNLLRPSTQVLTDKLRWGEPKRKIFGSQILGRAEVEWEYDLVETRIPRASFLKKQWKSMAEGGVGQKSKFWLLKIGFWTCFVLVWLISFQNLCFAKSYPVDKSYLVDNTTLHLKL